MKIIFLKIKLILSVTECNGPKYSPLGCFTDDPPFSIPDYRPPQMPESIETVNPIFKLSNIRYTDRLINWLNPDPRSFQHGDVIQVLTHGWGDSYDESSFINDARDQFKIKGNINFIGIDWSGGSKQKDYPTASANTQIIGRSIAYMFYKLKPFGHNHFQCAGHSLGAHACSYAAKYSKQLGFTIDK